MVKVAVMLAQGFEEIEALTVVEFSIHNLQRIGTLLEDLHQTEHCARQKHHP